MKVVYCIFSARSYEEHVLLYVITTKEEAERAITMFEIELNIDIDNGDSSPGQYWYYLEKELLERVET